MSNAASTYAPADDRYQTMPYRRCGRSGLKLPPVVLGGWHNFENEDFVREILTRAFDLGVTHLDLANNYGASAGQPGIAEINSGKILNGELRAHRDEIIVSTKAGYDMWPGPYGNGGSRKYLLASLDASLQRLGLDYVDVFYHHRPDAETPLEESMSAFETAVQSGKALYAAISNYDGPRTRHAASIMRDVGTPLIMNQSKYSMLTRNVETNGALDACGDNGMGLVAFSPLDQGLLTDKYLNDVPEDSRAATGSSLTAARITPELRRKLRRLNEIAKEREQSLSSLALSWVLRDPRVACVLVGASRVEQLEENVRAVQNTVPLSTEDEKRIEAVLSD